MKARMPSTNRFMDCMAPSLTPLHMVHIALARVIHEDFYSNRRYAATTSLTADGLAAQSVNILFQVCFPPSRRPRLTWRLGGFVTNSRE
jgi:hypothetical protein